MKIKIIYSLFLLLTSHFLYSYNKPNSITFDPKTKSYFISNNKGKTITMLDSNFNKKEVITGLVSPKDLLFATFGPYKGLLVLDSNQVKVFEADSFKLISTFDISGAIDLEDGEADKTKSNIYYISDSKAHKIFKVEIGGAPFYIPTFSTLCNFRNAKALLFDSKNRLLCTTDTAQSQVYIINTTTGNKSLLQNTSVDYINSIEEDLQGNFYATSWGDNYVYRLDKDFKNAKSLMGYSKPTGLIFNKMYDVLGVACSNCNKVEFYKLHMIYIDNADSAKCPGDSFYVNSSIMYKGIGTYIQGNNFIVELSDGNGKFTSPLKICLINNTTEPNSFKATLPKNYRFNGKSYKIRIKSTNPSFYSLNDFEVHIPYVPSSDFFDKDTIKYCSSNNIILGKKINSNDTLLSAYKWFKNGKVFQNSKTIFEYSGIGNHKFLLKAIPDSMGCIVSDSVFLFEYIKIKIPFKDTVKVCQKADAIIGGDSIDNTTIVWIDKTTQKDYGNKFNFTENWKNGNTNRIFTAKLKSAIAECTAEKDIYLIYKNLPEYSLLVDTIYNVCTNDVALIKPEYIRGDTQNSSFHWLPEHNLNTPFKKSVIFKNTSNINSEFKYKLIYSDTASKCSDSLSCKIINYQNPPKPILKQRSNNKISVINFDKKFQYNYKIFNKNNSVLNGNLADSSLQIIDFEQAKSAIVGVLNNEMCDTISDTLFIIDFNRISKIKKLPFIIFPNPSDDFINIKTANNSIEKIKIKINDNIGRTLINSEFFSNQSINISELKFGYYFLIITFENKIYNTVLIKK